MHIQPRGSVACCDWRTKLKRREKLSDLQRDRDNGTTATHGGKNQRRRNGTNLINNLLLFDPIIFKVVVHIQDENGKFIEVVKIQPEDAQSQILLARPWRHHFDTFQQMKCSIVSMLSSATWASCWKATTRVWSEAAPGIPEECRTPPPDRGDTDAAYSAGK